jgi:hypothetical protein
MIICFFSFLGIAIVIKLANDSMIEQMFKELGQSPKYYRNTYQLPRTINPLSNNKNYD